MEPATTRIKINPSFWRHLRPVPFSEDVVPSSLFLRHKHYLVFDIETQNLIQDVGGWDNVDQLKISVACAYDSKTNQMLTFRENELEELFSLMQERLVVGYNIRGFDLIVCEAYGLDLKGLDVFDIMYDVETLTRTMYLKLEQIAQGTLNVGKSADGLMAVEWFKQGRMDLIIEYCQQDVQVTRDVFEHGRMQGHVKIKFSEENIRTVPVSWN